MDSTAVPATSVGNGHGFDLRPVASETAAYRRGISTSPSRKSVPTAALGSTPDCDYHRLPEKRHSVMTQVEPEEPRLPILISDRLVADREDESNQRHERQVDTRQCVPALAGNRETTRAAPPIPANNCARIDAVTSASKKLTP